MGSACIAICIWRAKLLLALLMIGIIIIPLASHAIFLLPLKQAYLFTISLMMANGVIHYQKKWRWA